MKLIFVFLRKIYCLRNLLIKPHTVDTVSFKIKSAGSSIRNKQFPKLFLNRSFNNKTAMWFCCLSREHVFWWIKLYKLRSRIITIRRTTTVLLQTLARIHASTHRTLARILKKLQWRSKRDKCRQTILGAGLRGQWRSKRRGQVVARVLGRINKICSVV